MACSIWTYKDDKNYPGFHFSGCGSEVVALLEKFKRYSKSSMQLTAPPSEMLNIANSRSKVDRLFSKLKIIESSDSCIDDSSEILKISLSQVDYESLLNAIKSYEGGENDFNLPIDDTQLWFW